MGNYTNSVKALCSRGRSPSHAFTNLRGEKCHFIHSLDKNNFFLKEIFC